MSLLDVLKDPALRVPRGSEGAPGIVELPEPDEVVLPLEYPGQILFSPLVQAGDEVARFQTVGRSELGNCVHAPVSGRVKEIRTTWSARSYHVPAVVIERGSRPALTVEERLDQCGLDPQRAPAADRFRAAGVISPWSTPGQDHREADLGEYPEIAHLVITGCDEEPTVFVHERLMQEHADELLEGLRRMRDLAPKARIWLTARRPLAGWARETFGAECTVVGLPESYRHRVERLVVPRITGVPVPHAEAYRSHGVAVMSPEHVLMALGALRTEPVTHKTVTIAGRHMERPLTVRAALGTTVREVLRTQGLDGDDYGRIVMGGPMRGHALFTPDTPLSKFQDGIYLLGRDELPSEINLTCINCGRCTRACSAHLQVHLIGRCVEYDQLADSLDHHPEACVECGLCTFVCPSHRPLVQLVRMAKRFRSSQS